MPALAGAELFQCLATAEVQKTNLVLQVTSPTRQADAISGHHELLCAQ
jgi:hypothetical protein